MIAALEVDVSVSLIWHIQKATPKSTADRDEDQLIRGALLVGWDPTDLIVGSVVERCATNEEAVEATESHKPLITIITVPKTLFPSIPITRYNCDVPFLSWIAFSCSEQASFLSELEVSIRA